MSFFKPHRPSSLMGLTLEGRQLEGVVLHRSNGSFKVVQTFRTALSLDPLTNDPELVGREIRNHLEEAGVRERRCAVCLPLPWVLSLHAKIPDIPETDVPAFLNLEAERGFPYAPDDLSMANSRYRAPEGGKHASLLAIPRSHLTHLEKSLRAARLQPLSFSLGIAALRENEPETGLLTLVVGEHAVELQVSVGGGVAALRVLEGAIETEGAERRYDTGLIAREIRITLGQLPAELRETVRQIQVFGRPDWAESLAKKLGPVVGEMGLSAGLGTPPPVNGHPMAMSDRGLALPACCLASKLLFGIPPAFEFLPPKESQWTRLATRFSSARVLYAGAAAAAVLAVVGMAFLWQQWNLSSLESQWRAIKPDVGELEALQKQTRKFRPWYDESLSTLRIMRRLTEAFPEDGAVSAKILQIKDLAEVTCSGQARDNNAWLRLLDRLRESPQITELKVQQVRGKSPLQFNFSFRWSEGVRHEN